jgi:hypothetical protein
MQTIIKYFVLILIVSLGVSCGSKFETGSINIENWKNDRYGCKGLRLKDIEELKRLRSTFLGENNQALIKTFGRPDRVELVDKSQSYFYYFLEPSEDCGIEQGKSNPLKISFRLNAISKVSEVTISTY